jgi:Icc-related predicted phosphoesterase
MTHRILCYSDTHGNPPGHLDPADAVALLHGGDFYRGQILRHVVARDSTEEDREELRRVTHLQWLESAKLPVFGVRGNHDVADPLGVFSHVTDVSGSVVQIAPRLFVVGIGWHGEQFFDLPREIDIERVCNTMRRAVLRKTTAADRLILLTHYPGRFPELFGEQNCSGTWWYESIRQFIQEIKPALVIQGHLHEHAGTRGIFEWKDGRSFIVNPGVRGAVVEIDMEANTAGIR